MKKEINKIKKEIWLEIDWGKMKESDIKRAITKAIKKGYEQGENDTIEDYEINVVKYHMKQERQRTVKEIFDKIEKKSECVTDMQYLNLKTGKFDAKVKVREIREKEWKKIKKEFE